MEIKVKTQSEPADQLLTMMLMPAKYTSLKSSVGITPRVDCEGGKKPPVRRICFKCHTLDVLHSKLLTVTF